MAGEKEEDIGPVEVGDLDETRAKKNEAKMKERAKGADATGMQSYYNGIKSECSRIIG